MSARVRRLNEPVPVRVRVDALGHPVAVAGHRQQQVRSGLGGASARHARGRRYEAVECVVDTWHVDEAWWTGAPVRRSCHEVQLAGGGRFVLSLDLEAGTWLAQR